MRASPPIALAFCLLLAAALCTWPSPSAAEPKPAGAPREYCPVITVECPSELVQPGVPINFKAKISGAGPDRKLTFQWVASAGTFTSGAQGEVAVSKGDAEFTAVLDTTGVPGNSLVTATVEVGGLDRSCSNSNSCTTGTVRTHHPHAMDSYGNIRFADEMARLDNFAFQVQNDPDFHAFIECYGGRVGQRGEARARCERAKRYLTGRRGIAPGRIVLVDGGFREELSVGLWLLPAGTNFTPSPTVDPTEVRFTRATAGKRSKKRAPQQRHITP